MQVFEQVLNIAPEHLGGVKYLFPGVILLIPGVSFLLSGLF